MTTIDTAPAPKAPPTVTQIVNRLSPSQLRKDLIHSRHLVQITEAKVKDLQERVESTRLANTLRLGALREEYDALVLSIADYPRKLRMAEEDVETERFIRKDITTRYAAVNDARILALAAARTFRTKALVYLTALTLVTIVAVFVAALPFLGKLG